MCPKPSLWCYFKSIAPTILPNSIKGTLFFSCSGQKLSQQWHNSFSLIPSVTSQQHITRIPSLPLVMVSGTTTSQLDHCSSPELGLSSVFLQPPTLLPFQQDRHKPASRSLHLLFPLPRTLFPKYLYGSFSHLQVFTQILPFQWDLLWVPHL